MHCNYKIKHAVTSALSILAIGFHSTPFALGLSDIQLQSHLGEPLKATINVLGANDLKSASCLRLGPNSDLKNLKLNLGKVTGNTGKITITSRQVINEPILNVAVVAGCESSITRDYVLLLDPPTGLVGAATNVSTADVNTANDTATVEKIDNADKSSTNAAIATTQNSVAKPQQKKTNIIKTKARSSKKTKAAAKKSTGTPRVNKPAALEKSKINAQPRLSISTGFATPYTSTSGLVLDRQLTFKPDSNVVIASEDIAIDDEVTVMNNRLAHLQAQITKLQEQNTKLKTQNKNQSDQLAVASAKKSSLSGALSFVGASLLLLLSGYVGYNWYRRRQMQLQDHQTNAIWVNSTHDKNQNLAEESATPSDPKADNLFTDVNFGISSTQNPEKEEKASPEATMESTFESTRTEESSIVLEDEQQFSVLDHADVFLSHGRATLAIQLLQNHLIEHPKQSVTIWLFLLDLIAKENLEEVYKETALDCKLHYNVKIAEFSAQDASSNESLEDFPHLAKGLEDVWNTPEAVVFLDDLIYNNRLEPRAGLPKNLVEELILLRTMASERAESAEVIRLDEKKLAIIEQKEALLEAKKADKLKKIEEAEEKARKEAAINAQAADETSFEFTLVER